MAGTTTKGLRYPSNGDAPNVAVDIQHLADDVDSELDNYLTIAAGATYDQIRVTGFMLGGM